MDLWLLCRGAGLQERGMPRTVLPREAGASFSEGVEAWVPLLPYPAYSSTKGQPHE